MSIILRDTKQGILMRDIVKESSILEIVEKNINERTGNFIGMLNGKIGNDSFKNMKRERSYKVSIKTIIMLQ